MQVKRLFSIFLFIIMFCGPLTFKTSADIIFVVSGKVFLSDGSLAQDGLTVIVENTNTGVSGKGATGKLGPGLYSATLFDPTNLSAVTKDGHLLRITVKDGEQIVGTATHVVTKEEAEAFSAENVNIRLSGLTAKVEPSSLVGDGKSQATITVTVTGSDGKGIAGDTLTVTAKLGSVGAIKDNQDGTYTAVYTAPLISTPQADEIVISSKKLNVSTTISVSLRLKAPPAEVSIKVVPPELTANGVSKATVTVTVQRDGKPVVDELVTIEVTGEGKIGSVTNQRDGTYTATYTASTKAGVETLTATATQSERKVTTTITLKAGPATSVEVTASPTTLMPDGVSKSLLTAIAKDAYGNPVDGEKVTFSIKSGSGTIGTTTAQGQGKYTATYTTDVAKEPSKIVIIARTASGISGEVNIDLVPEMLLIVSGVVLEVDRATPVPDGLLADVRIPTLDITGSALTASGRYEVSFIDPSKKLALGAPVRTTIRSSDGEVIYGSSETYKLTEVDLLSKKLTLDVVINRTSEFTIYGKVTKVDDGTPVMGATVSARGKNIKTIGSGSYSLEFNELATNPVEGEAIKISVSTPAGTLKTLEVTAHIEGRKMEVNIPLDVIPAKADAGPDQFVKPGETITLDGSKTSDNSEIKSYIWDFDANDGLGEDASGAIASASYGAEGVYIVTLTVTDQDNNSAKDTLTVTVDGKAVIEPVRVEGSSFMVGKPIKVTVIAEPNGIARFSIAGIEEATNLAMEEVSNGVYEGKYVVQAGDNITNTPLIVNFTDRAGNQITDSSQKVSIDTIPPAPPLSLAVAGNIIDQSNVKIVQITGRATPKASLIITLKDESQKVVTQTAIAGDDGSFRAIVDASSLKDGLITVEAFEEKDIAGNLGLPSSITVRKDLAPPPVDFIINAITPTQTSEAGGEVVYLLEIIGRNGFSDEVRLNAIDLPKMVEEKFDPLTLTPSKTEPTRNSQLTLSIPTDIAEGEYKFSVWGLVEGGISRKTILTMNIQRLSSNLSLLVNPREVKLRGNVKVFGQLFLDKPDERKSVKVNFIYTLPNGETIEAGSVEALRVEKAFEYYSEFSPDKMGEWHVTVKFAGDTRYKPTERSSSFMVGKGASEITFIDPIPESAKLKDHIAISGRLSPNLKGENITLALTVPGELGSMVKSLPTSEFGIFNYDLELDKEGRWEINARWSGNEEYEPTSSELFSLDVVRGIGKFILVQGGGDEVENEAWDAFLSVIEKVYDALMKTTFSHDDIYFLNPAKAPSKIKYVDGVQIVDATVSKEALEFAIKEWAAPMVGPDIPLYIYLLSHNLDDNFLLAGKGKESVILTSEMMDEWLSALKPGTPVTTIIEACYSGGFIRRADGSKTPLPKQDRTIITSSRNDSQSFIQKGSSFSFLFFDGIRRNYSVKDAFDRAEKRLKGILYHSQQFPQLDANGNGIALENIDYAAVEAMYIPTKLTSLPIFPEIYKISDSQTISKGRTEAKIWAEVGGGSITKVWAFIVPPDYNPEKKLTSWSEAQFPDIELLDDDKDGIYENSYNQFTQPGEYKIIVSAQNSEGVSAEPVQTTVYVLPRWDANGDGAVDILDLALVVENYGGQGPDGDVNGDKSVDILDLVIVGKHYGE